MGTTIKLVGVMAFLLITPLLFQYQSYLISFHLYDLGPLTARLDFALDAESNLFCLSLIIILSAVITYSQSYIRTEKYFNRFTITLTLFAVSIVTLIIRANLYAVIIGWDGLGVTSFLLVIFFHNKNSANAGLLTILTNRVGDTLIMTAMALIVSSNSIGVTIAAISGQPLPRVLSTLIILAAFTKRAQIPFSR